MKKVVVAKLKSKDQINSNVYRFTLSSQELAEQAKPGQFLDIKCDSGYNTLLRRPISISDIDKENKTIEIIFQVKGSGTKELSLREEGEDIDILGPLGKGFELNDNYKKIAVIGGGIGIFPLIPLIKQSKAKVSTFLGFRDVSQVMLENEFKEISDELLIATDDGSFGQKGRVPDLLRLSLQKDTFDMIYACGPKPMLMAVQAAAKEFNLPCQLSLEERMGCGVGACLGCACKVKSQTEDWDYKHVCKDGPVFSGDEVIFDE